MSAASAVDDDTIAATIRRLAEERGPDRTLCPSEVARRLDEDWRPLMPQVRRVADELAARGAVAVTQKGRPASAVDARGPVRLGLPRDT